MEHRPVHMVLPSPVSWVPDVRPSSEEVQGLLIVTDRFSPFLPCLEMHLLIHIWIVLQNISIQF